MSSDRALADILTDAVRDIVAQRNAQLDALVVSYARSLDISRDDALAHAAAIFADAHEHTFTRGFDLDAVDAYLDAHDFRIRFELAYGRTCPGAGCPAVERARTDGWT